MEGSEFDRLARDLAASHSRRQVLRRLLGATAATLGIGVPVVNLLRAPDGEAAQTCRPGGDICLKDGNCCSSKCKSADATGRRRCECEPKTTPCGTSCCGAGAVCINGACRIATPTSTPTPTPTNTPTATATPVCLPGGEPCEVLNPGECCSKSCENDGNDNYVCGADCLAPGEPCDVLNAGECCSKTCEIDGNDNMVCGATCLAVGQPCDVQNPSVCCSECCSDDGNGREVCCTTA